MSRLLFIALVILLVFLVKSARSQASGEDIQKQSDTSGFKRTSTFYDSVYHKFSRNKFTRLLYGLAFIPPRITSLPDTVQVIESHVPYNEFKGKIIRKIRIRTLLPFGETIYDTTDEAKTTVGRSLNAIHIRTREYVIRRNLLFKCGQPLDPNELGDNERIIRDLAAIDNVRIVVTPAGADSVDLTVISKDVFSIGFDVPVLALHKLGFRLYDANFLGLGDRFTVNMSTELYRAPFFRFDGASYTFTNILGSFINAGIEYDQENTGDQRFLVTFDRPFLTNKIKWAGGASAGWYRKVNTVGDTALIASRYKGESCWVGRAFLLKKETKISRFVASAAVYRRQYSFRPDASMDSNSVFSNDLQLLGALSYSQNNYFVTDYLFDFGKTENLPYGQLYQVTFGPDYNELYARFYGGITLAAGNFIPHFGYMQGYIKLSGYLHNESFEDGVLKVDLRYFTPLIHFTDTRYKFRTFITTDYRTGINMRAENLDYDDVNRELNVKNLNRSDIFHGNQTFSTNLGTVVYTPWYFYGFRFALSGQLQAGLAAAKQVPFWKSSLFLGFGTSLTIKNDNLVFPAFIISGYLYPVAPVGVPVFNGMLTTVTRLYLSDFNVSAPHIESLGN